jgi:3-oxoacyl-[acyl-carrier protein] reductase
MSEGTNMLEGKTALVTGASRGIGEEITRVLLREGAKVYGFSRTKPAIEGDFHWIGVDVGDAESISSGLKELLAGCGTIDILVNNAGITRDGLVFRMKDEDWEDVMRINLTSAFRISREISRLMVKARSGSIINISSVVGISGNGGQTNYAASKAGLIGFSKSLAREVAGRGIRVNVVAPGFVDTSMTEGLSEKLRENLSEKIPLGRTAKAHEIAEAVLFLATERASYITGQVLAVDGGMTM